MIEFPAVSTRDRVDGISISILMDHERFRLESPIVRVEQTLSRVPNLMSRQLSSDWTAAFPPPVV